MKGKLLFMHALPRIIRRKSIARFPPCLLFFDRFDLFYNISHNHHEYGKNTLAIPIIITVMKKFILSAFLPLLYFLYSLFSPLTAPIVYAAATQATAGGYACILGDETFFYSARDEKRGLFLLPQTYYVKLLEISPDFCKIEYLYDDTYTQKLVGYARTSELTFVDYVPKRPYLYQLFDVRYTIDGTVSEDSSFLNQITITCAYYGDYRIGSETYCYVLRDDSFGYIPKPTDLIYEQNTEYAEWLALQTPSEDVDPKEDGEENTSSPAQTAILVALCLLVPVLAALILRPSKRQPYDQEE